MKHSTGFAYVAAIGCLLLSACASTGSTYSSLQRQEVDRAKIAEVHRQARETGALVTWFNLPTRRVDNNDG
jgi:hypothetical protein